MTWLEMIDTAIKIGLGAIVGGLFTLLINKQTHKYQVDKEIILDNRQTLKNASEKFESIHQIVISLAQKIMREGDLFVRKVKELYQKYGITTWMSAEELQHTQIPEDEFQQIHLPDFYKQSFDATEKLSLELYSLNGVLLLYGYEDMSSVIGKYTENIEKFIPITDNELSNKDALKEYLEFRSKLDEGLKISTKLRQEFYWASRSYFKNK